LATTNFQDVVNAKASAALLKDEYYKSLAHYVQLVGAPQQNLDLIPDSLLKVQKTGADYFNFYEEFVGNSSLLGAHDDAVWVQGFGEDCFAVLQVMPKHFENLQVGFNEFGLDISAKPMPTAFANMQRLCKKAVSKDLVTQLESEFVSNGLPVYGFRHKEKLKLKLDGKAIIAACFFVVFTIVLIGLAIVLDHPTAIQIFVFKFVAALVAACAGMILSGFIEVRFGKWLRAGGAFALFAIVYFMNPAKLVEGDDVQVTPSPPSIEQASK